MRLQALEAVEHALAIGLRDARAAIVDLQQRAVRRRLQRHVDVAVAPART